MKNATLFFTLVEIQLALLLISPIMAQDKSPRTLSKVDAELVCICGETFSPYAERVRLIHRLPSNLTPEQLERCRASRRPRPCAAIARLRAEADIHS